MPKTPAPLTLAAALSAALSVSLLAACSSSTSSSTGSAPSSASALRRAIKADSGEANFGGLTQLTDGGENAEAYFSADGQFITFQSTRDGRTCDQQYTMRADGSELTKVSRGGKTTCGWFLPGNKRLFFGATHHADSACPPKPDPSAGYVWGIDPYDIYTVDRDGKDMKRLTNYGVYTAEGVLSPDGKRIVFTSLKDGDLDIYTMNVDGSDVKRLTTTPGYDGGPWWSPDGSKIVYRAWHYDNPTDLKAYQDLLKKGMIRPNRMELFVMNADGSDQRQITKLGGANFGPSWTPDGKAIIFSSNHKNPRSRNFDLYTVQLDGNGLKQITTNPEFDGFPMFSPDGKKLIFASNRGATKAGETNLFIAEWKN
jgi:Tol biopolymer transport system component